MPSESGPTSIECAGCGRRYVWKPQLAGRTVKCGCGTMMKVSSAPPEEHDDLYDLAPEAKSAPSPANPSSEPRPVATVQPSAARAIEYRRAGAEGGGGAVDDYFPDRVKDLYLPLALIVGGTVIEFALGLFERASLSGAAETVVSVGLYMIANTILMLAAIFIVAKMRGITFGPVPTAVLKLCAISIGPGAIGSLVGLVLGWIPFGGLIGWVVGFILYFALIGAIFDLDEPDTWWCVITIFGVKLLAVVVIIGYLLR